MTKATRTAAERYPLAVQALARLLGDAGTGTGAAEPALVAGPIGPQILRAPPEIQRKTEPDRGLVGPLDDDANPTRSDDLLGELVDMVFVSAHDGTAPGEGSEVHLVFKAEVLGGLHLRLKKMTAGMQATFFVEDAAARRAVLAHVDGLVAHLQRRGFTISGHEVLIGNGTP